MNNFHQIIDIIDQSGTVDIDLNDFTINHVCVEFNGNGTLNFQNLLEGAILYLATIQKTPGGHTISFTSGQVELTTPNDIMTTTAGSQDCWTFVVHQGKLLQFGFKADVK